MWLGTERQLRISDEPPPFALSSAESPAAGAPRELEQESAAPEAGPETTPGAALREEPAPSTSTQPSDRPAEKAPSATAGTITFAFDPIDVRVPEGLQFSVRVTARASDPFATCAFDVVFDGSLLEVVRVEQGRSIRSGFVGTAGSGRVSIAFDAARDFDGTACRIIFLAKASGTTQVLIENAHVKDAAGLELLPSSTPSSVQVAAPIAPGAEGAPAISASETENRGNGETGTGALTAVSLRFPTPRTENIGSGRRTLPAH